MSYLLVGAVALVSRLAEMPAVRALSLPVRGSVYGLGLFLPVLGLTLGAALFRPQALEKLTDLLLLMAALAAGMGLLAVLWGWLERVWILPAREPGEDADGQAKDG